MKAYIRKISLILFIILSSNIYSQTADLFATPSVDGCIYVNSKEKKIILIDKVYSDLELKEDEIIFDSESSKKYDNVFQVDEIKKYQYFLIEVIGIDSNGIYANSEKVSIRKQELNLNNDWSLINFDFIKFSSQKKIKLCSEKNETGIEYSKSVILKGNKELLINFNKDSQSYFTILMPNSCDIIHNETFDKNDIKIWIDDGFCFMHSGYLLYIIKTG